MAGTTSRFGLALMSGGSDDPSPDEVADVKVINDGLKLIDGFLGIKECTSGTRPASPKMGQLIVETDTGVSLYWNGSIWVPVMPKATLLGSVSVGTMAIGNSGALGVVATKTFATAVAQRVLLNATVTITAGGNYAGYLQIFLNGAQIGDGYRVANFGSATPISFSRMVKGITAIGVNTMQVKMNAEPGGVIYTAQNTLLDAWSD